MTYEEMLRDTIERIQQADAADLSAIHEYLVWSQGRYKVEAMPKAKLTPEQGRAGEVPRGPLLELADLEASRAQAAEDQAAGLLG